MKNVLIIHTDQQRYDSLGCTGNPYVDTPNIDQLAREGTLFTRHVAGNPVCTPSRCCLMTGRYPPGHGTWANGMALARREYVKYHHCENWVFPPEDVIPEIPTVADRFAAAGYRTACFGKLHLTPNQAHPSYGYDECFETWQSGEMNGWRGPYYGFQHVELTQGHGETPCLLGPYSQWLKENHREVYDRVVARDKENMLPHCAVTMYASEVPSELHHSRWLADRFAAYLDDRREGSEASPFMAFIGFPDPHHPITPSYDLAERYQDRGVLPAVDHEGIKKPHMDHLKHVDHFTEEDRTKVRQYTHAMIEGIDRAVGRILFALEEKGMLDETVIVFTSDHGDFLCDHAVLEKENLCAEPLVHVPCILRAPGEDLPSTWDKPISSVDVLPTVMRLAGLDAPADVDGCDVSAEMAEDGKHQVFSYAFHETPEYHNMAVYDGDYKLLYYPRTERTELYNVRDDPHEMTDLAADPDQAERVRQLTVDAARGLMKHTRAIGHRVAVW